MPHETAATRFDSLNCAYRRKLFSVVRIPATKLNPPIPKFIYFCMVSSPPAILLIPTLAVPVIVERIITGIVIDIF